jgi:regulator of replication initiation timing
MKKSKKIEKQAVQIVQLQNQVFQLKGDLQDLIRKNNELDRSKRQYKAYLQQSMEHEQFFLQKNEILSNELAQAYTQIKNLRTRLINITKAL